MNDYLRDRAMKRRDYRQGRDMARGRRGGSSRDYGYEDMRNPYGSKGGYVRSSRDYANDMARGGRGRDYAREENYYNGMPIPARNGFRDDYTNYQERRTFGDEEEYHYNDYSSGEDEKEYYEYLKEWIEKLKRKDRFGLSKEQVMREAKSMGVKYNDYDEMEYYATYLMISSLHPKLANDYHQYLQLAKEWLEDDMSKRKGSDKLCAYLYEIVLKEEDDD